MTLPAWFSDYLALKADRPGVLLSMLGNSGIVARELRIAGARHVIAFPKNLRRSPAYRMKIVTAHHDRVMGTQGALDNSAAALQIVNFLAGDSPAFNTVMMFTDHEELGGSAATEQGSFALGKAFSTLGFNAPVVFSLDVTGRGDTLVLSTATEILLEREKGMERLITEVEDTATSLLRRLSGRIPATRARVPFGEDLGFLCAGQASLVLTVLPSEELALLRGEHHELPAWASVSKSVKPATWRYLHSSSDTVSLYDDSAFVLMATLLERLASWRIPNLATK